MRQQEFNKRQHEYNSTQHEYNTTQHKYKGNSGSKNIALRGTFCFGTIYFLNTFKKWLI